MKYRKKPVEVEAWQWKGNIIFSDEPDWVWNAVKDGKIEECIEDNDEDSFLSIETLEGTQIVKPGDYIIKGVKGELYPCKPDIFEMTYEEINE